MGIRVTAFVVDVVQFHALIERPLWQVLLEVSRVPFDGDAIFGAYDEETQTRFLVKADRGIARTNQGAGLINVPADELSSVPFLRQTTRHYLSRSSSYNLSFLLRSWSLFPDQSCVRTIARGDRSMWLEAIVEAAASNHLLAQNELTELASFVGRILRSRHRRIRRFAPEVQHGPPIVPATFPVVPADDSDNEMAVFDEYEMLRLAEMLDRLVDRKPSYVMPVYGGVAANSSVDQAKWERLVSSTVDWLRHAPEHPIRSPHLVTFVG